MQILPSTRTPKNKRYFARLGLIKQKKAIEDARTTATGQQQQILNAKARRLNRQIERWKKGDY